MDIMKLSNYSRRDFLRTAGLAVVATAAPRIAFAENAIHARQTAYKYPNPGKIVIVFHPNAVIGYNNADYNIVQQMFDEGIIQFTGITSSAADALASLFPGLTTAKKIAIKPNIYNASVPARKELAKAIVTRLVQMLGGYSPANITFYERHGFTSVGYTASYFGQAVNLVTDTAFPDLGYSIHCNGKDRPYSKSLHDADYLINMPVLKSCNCGTNFPVTLAFKNHMGTVNPSGTLGIHVDKTAVLDIMADAVMTTKQRIVITDCLFTMYDGGPSGTPQATPQKIMISQDPVTSDYQGLKLINELRVANGLQVKTVPYIDEASKTPYEIGVADPALMNVISINLPVELTAFTAVLDDEGVLLQWTTERETNNRGFDIERSIDGVVDWENVGFVKGKGTTARQSEYRFVDALPAKARDRHTICYRLRQNDFDGSYKYSFVVHVQPPSTAASWRIDQNYPNPFNTETEIPLHVDTGMHVRVDVLDATGSIVAVLHASFMEPGARLLRWDAAKCAAGVYTCRATVAGLTKEIRMILLK
jgi:uncharacterized protein (DUF362 family)